MVHFRDLSACDYYGLILISGGKGWAGLSCTAYGKYGEIMMYAMAMNRISRIFQIIALDCADWV